MKQLFLILLSLCMLLITAHAQLLWGTTSQGGKHNNGTISSYDVQSKTISAPKSFSAVAFEPVGKLALAPNGKYYGVTNYGGDQGFGAIFSYDVAADTVIMVASFNDTDGAYPSQSLVLAPNGKLYGTTANGGASYAGNIYSFDPATNAITNLYDFSYPTAEHPQFGNLLVGNNGKLYGTGAYGGANDNGVLYSFDIATNTYTALFDFDQTNGSNPYGSVIGASDGKLYGITTNGGNNGVGVIYSFDTTTNTLTDVHNFDNNTGGYPQAGLTQATDGNLYGLAGSGGANSNGVLYAFHPGDNTYTDLHDFNYTDGAYPYGSELLQASNGKLYGMTEDGGGTYGGGVVFSYDITNSSYDKLLNLDNTTGDYPLNGFVEGANGNLYGLTQRGGSTDNGVLFSYNITTDNYTKINDFGSTSDGSNPYGGLLLASNGKMYGMTVNGGKYGVGVLYSFNPSNSNFTKLLDFDNSNGAYPYGNVIQATNGKFYGMTSGGGANNDGVLFSYDPSTNTYTKLLDFDGTNGANPNSSLLQTSNGKLYGMAVDGGDNNAGVIFSYDISTSTFTKLHDFNGTDGAEPYGDPLEVAGGKLYGLTTSGGTNNAGVIFSFNTTTANFTKLYDLQYDSTGGNPTGNLMQASNGKLYGLTGNGGAFGAGTIFSYDPAASLVTDLHDFNGNDGAVPNGTLLEATYGKLYGMTPAGGVDNDGVVFSYDFTGSSYQLLQSYTGDNGAAPIHFAFVETNIPKPIVKIRDVAVTEGNSGQKNMNFKVTLSAKQIRPVTVNYSTVNKTAKAPGDYIATSGTLTFNPGENSKPISVVIKGDRQVEPDETLKIKLSHAVNATLRDSVGVGTILNDDHRNTISDLKIDDALTGNERTVVVSPNPANSVANVRLNGYQGNVTIQVWSMEGRMMKELKTSAAGSNQQINVADLASGTYFLSVIDEDGLKATTKLVIVR